MADGNGPRQAWGPYPTSPHSCRGGRRRRERTLTWLAGVGSIPRDGSAIAEELAPKCEIFATLDGLLAPEVIFATTTSSLSVIELAACTSRMDKFLGIHFFNPAPVMSLVEVVSTVATELARGLPLPAAVAKAKRFITEAIRFALPLGSGHGPTNPLAAAQAVAAQTEERRGPTESGQSPVED